MVNKKIISILAVVLLCKPATATPLLLDPEGDTFGAPNVSHDIAFVDSLASASSITFIVGFHNAIQPPSAFAADSVVGFIDIDVDQNSLTGEESNTSRFGPAGTSDLGIEYLLDLFSERFNPGMVDVVQASTMQVLGLAPIVFEVDRFEVAVPLGLIGDDPFVNYSVIVGDFLDMSDVSGTVSTVPEPTTFMLFALGVLTCLLRLPRDTATSS